jgi:hypothetical protein
MINLEMNRDTAEKILQKFNERVDTVNYALSHAIGVDLDDNTFEGSGFRVFLRTVGKNPENCVHTIVVDILGVVASIKNVKGVYVGESIVIFEDDKGSGVIFDIANGS